MKPAPFGYHAPADLDEALALLAELGPEAKVLAGGQSLVPVLNMRLANPAHLVDLNRVPGLDHVRVEDDAVVVGALVRHAALLSHSAARTAQPLLRQALSWVAHPAIRNRGTTVGSIVHADPSGEMPTILAVTDGSVLLRVPEDDGTLPAGGLIDMTRWSWPWQANEWIHFSVDAQDSSGAAPHEVIERATMVGPEGKVVLTSYAQ